MGTPQADLATLSLVAQDLSRSDPSLQGALDHLASGAPFVGAHLRLVGGEKRPSLCGGDPAVGEAARLSPGLRPHEHQGSTEPASWRPLTGDPRETGLRTAGVKSYLSAPIGRAGARHGVLELFLSTEEPPPGSMATAVVAAQLFASRIAAAEDETYREYFDSSGLGVAIGTVTGDLLRVNRAYAAFLGREPRQVVGRNISELIVPDDIPHMRKALEDLHAGRIDRDDLEGRYPRPDGSTVWGRWTVTRLGRTGLLLCIVQDVDANKRAEEAVRNLSGRLLHLQDEERRRIARSLHESAAQTVAALSMSLQRMERMSLPAHAIEMLADSLDLVTQCSREIRTLSHLLHPPLLEEAGLPSSLRWYVHGFGTRSDVAVSMEIADDLGRLPTELEITLFRVAQESLTNVHRHAGAQRATIRLRRIGTEVTLEIEDDGIGIPTDVMERIRRQNAAMVGVGIAGMRERLSQLGGTLEVESNSKGTRVRARLRSAA
jgi:PAS domain S-box-containing protein